MSDFEARLYGQILLRAANSSSGSKLWRGILLSPTDEPGKDRGDSIARALRERDFVDDPPCRASDAHTSGSWVLVKGTPCGALTPLPNPFDATGTTLAVERP